MVAASAGNEANASVDPLRTRYIGLTTKAESEGEKLAQISGGVYCPITRLSGFCKKGLTTIIVLQLRTAYSVTFRSDVADTRNDRASPHLKVKVKREILLSN